MVIHVFLTIIEVGDLDPSNIKDYAINTSLIHKRFLWGDLCNLTTVS